MAATDRVGRVVPVVAGDPAPEVPVVFVPPATPEEHADAKRRLVEALDWVATIGALDA